MRRVPAWAEGSKRYFRAAKGALGRPLLTETKIGKPEMLLHLQHHNHKIPGA